MPLTRPQSHAASQRPWRLCPAEGTVGRRAVLAKGWTLQLLWQTPAPVGGWAGVPSRGHRPPLGLDWAVHPEAPGWWAVEGPSRSPSTVIPSAPGPLEALAFPRTPAPWEAGPSRAVRASERGSMRLGLRLHPGRSQRTAARVRSAGRTPPFCKPGCWRTVKGPGQTRRQGATCLHPSFQSHSMEVLADLAGRRSLGGRVLIADFFFFFHSFSFAGDIGLGLLGDPFIGICSFVFFFAAGSTDVSKSQPAAAGKCKQPPHSSRLFLPKIREPCWRACSILKEAGTDFPEENQHCRGNKRTGAANRWEGVQRRLMIYVNSAGWDLPSFCF